MARASTFSTLRGILLALLRFFFSFLWYRSSLLLQSKRDWRIDLGWDLPLCGQESQLDSRTSKLSVVLPRYSKLSVAAEILMDRTNKCGFLIVYFIHIFDRTCYVTANLNLKLEIHNTVIATNREYVRGNSLMSNFKISSAWECQVYYSRLV